jgi:predicted esterase
MVPFEWSKDLVTYLEAQGYQPIYRTYAIDHEISASLMADLRSWVKKVLPTGSAE